MEGQSLKTDVSSAGQALPSPPTRPRSVIVAGGGTAGHITPGLAILRKYAALMPDSQLYFMGCSTGLEKSLAPAAGFTLVEIPGSPFKRQRALGQARALSNLVRGVMAARHELRRLDADIVIGLGGYASAGALLAARSLGIATVVHEANVRPGMANRWLGRLVDRVLVGWPGTQSAFPRSRTLVTGNPILTEAVKSSSSPVSDHFRILVTGGSMGSPFLNQHAPTLLGRVAAAGIRFDVQHQTGDESSQQVHRDYESFGIPSEVVPFIDDMAEAYRLADFVISCAGAITLAELAAYELPSLIVPLRAAAENHQYDNAQAFAHGSDALVSQESEWDEAELAARLGERLSEPRIQRTDRSQRPVSDPSRAATRVVEACEELLRPRR